MTTVTTQTQRQVKLTAPALIMGTAAAGTAVGARLAGGVGAVTGAVVGAVLGAIAAGTVKSATFVAAPDRRLHLHIEFR